MRLPRACSMQMLHAWHGMGHRAEVTQARLPREAHNGWGRAHGVLRKGAWSPPCAWPGACGIELWGPGLAQVMAVSASHLLRALHAFGEFAFCKKA